jgi:hypothetical protein
MVNVHRWTGPAGLGSCPVAPELDRERGKGVEISRLHRGQPLAVYCSSSTWQRCSPARISTRPGSVVHGRRPVRRPLFLSSTAAPDAEIVHTQFAAPAWSAGTPAERTTGPVLGRGARPRRDGRTGGSVSRAFERGRSGSQGGREGESQSGRKKVLTGDRERRHGRTGKAKRRRKRNEPAHGMDGGRLVDTRRGPRGLDSGGDKRPTARHFHMSPLYGTAGPGQLRVRPCVPQKKKKKKKLRVRVRPVRPPQLPTRLFQTTTPGRRRVQLLYFGPNRAGNAFHEFQKSKPPSVGVRACLPLFR